MLNFFDWFVNQICGSRWMALLVLEALYAVILMVGKSSFNSISMILVVTSAIWLTTFFGFIWYVLFSVMGLIYYILKIASTVNKE